MSSTSGAEVQTGSGRASARIIVVGDEMLEGFVRDGNVRWLAARLREAGLQVLSVDTVRDDVAAIGFAVRRSLMGARPSLIVTTGGTGGTWDDVTYEALSIALDLPLVVHPDLKAQILRVIDWVESLQYTLDDDAVSGMMRIATVPDGSVVHFADEWLACVQLDVDGGFRAPAGCTVIALPGPPSHAQRLVDELVSRGTLPKASGDHVYTDVEHEYPEMLLVGEVRRIRHRYPRVTVGSYPGKPMKVRFSGIESDVLSAASELATFLGTVAAHPAAKAIRSAWSKQTWTNE